MIGALGVEVVVGEAVRPVPRKSTNVEDAEDLLRVQRRVSGYWVQDKSELELDTAAVVVGAGFVLCGAATEFRSLSLVRSSAAAVVGQPEER